MLVQSLADCVYKRSQQKGAYPETFLVFQSYSFGATALALVLALDVFRGDWTAWKYGPLCGLVGFVAYFCFLSSLKGGQASVNTMIFRLSFVLTAVLAVVFLGEPVTTLKLAGLCAAALAVLALTVFPGVTQTRAYAACDGASGGARTRSIALALAAMLLLGLLSFFYKLAARDGVPAPALIFIQFAFFSPTAMIYAGLRRRFVWHPVSAGHGLGAGVLLSGALILLVFALTDGDAGIVVPINQMSFVLVATLAVPWFGEAWTRWKTLAVLLAAAAVVLLAS
jgi:drug/metabolite transporter (DMT)-like permease